MFFELLTKPAHFPGLPSAAPCHTAGPALPELTPRQRGRWLARRQESPPRSRLPERQPLACPARPPSCPFNRPRWSRPWLLLSFGCGRRAKPDSDPTLSPAEGARGGTAPALLRCSLSKGSALLATLSNSCLFWRFFPLLKLCSLDSSTFFFFFFFS